LDTKTGPNMSYNATTSAVVCRIAVTCSVYCHSWNWRCGNLSIGARFGRVAGIIDMPVGRPAHIAAGHVADFHWRLGRAGGRVNRCFGALGRIDTGRIHGVRGIRRDGYGCGASRRDSVALASWKACKFHTDKQKTLTAPS
jgi:hypothetical protein